MLVTVGTIFLCFSLLLIIFFITSSKRQNICFLVSLFVSVSVSITFYVIEYYIDLNWTILLDFIHNTFKYLPTYPSDVEMQKAFGIGMILMFIFFVLFIISIILMNIFMPKEKYLLKKNRYYYVTKSIFVFINILLTLFTLIVITSILNIIYNIPAPFFDSILKIFEQGLLNL